MDDHYLERVARVVADARRLPPGSVTADTTFAELGIDSLDALDILFKMEEEFNVSIPGTDLPRVEGVRDLAACARALVEGVPDAAFAAQAQ